MKRAWWALLSLALSGAASAETRRIAVVVGNNGGAQDRSPLRYAEGDAGKLAETLVELGGIAPEDLFLLQGRSLAALKEVLDTATRRVAEWHAAPDTRVVLLFYFSGHSDGVALELGPDRLAFSDLRRWLSGTGAEVRLAIVDSCKSGALLAEKGGRPGPPFQIRLSDDLASHGEALLSSSAADELALESREIRGSFFTHHLVSGLRGAADSSGDGRVTLAEAYQYAFAHTVSATASTLIGPQHPGYDYRLAGRGELVLSSLGRPSATLEVPTGFDRILVTQLVRDQVLAELPAGAAVRVAVPPGDYAVRAFHDGQSFVGRVAVRAGEVRVVRRDELYGAAPAAIGAKGGEVTLARPAQARRIALFVAVGAQGGIASDVGALAAVRLGVRSARPSGWSVSLDLATGRGAGFFETTALLLGGYRLGLARGRLRLHAGVEVGGGLAAQNLDAGPAFRSAILAVAPFVGGALRISERVSLAIEGQLPVGWIRKDAADAVFLLPVGFAGLAVDL